jgi:hypothetical protein
MGLRSARLAQQIRLWIYGALLVLVILRAWNGAAFLPEVLMFCLIGLLFYSEICPVCGRLCWWELSPLEKWPNALWIGRECRQHSEKPHAPTAEREP